MTKYTGYVNIPHNSYQAWRSSTLDNGYDIDGSYGCQCWDFASEFWRNVGFPAGYPLITQSSVYAMWQNRNSNISYNGVQYFDLIENLEDVKRGDILVYNYFDLNPYGHVGFADEDYSTWHENNPNSYEFPILSQNNNGTPDPAGGAYVNVHGYDTRLFLGAFRYRPWHEEPPAPSYQHSKYPFILMRRRRRLLRRLGL